MTLADLEFDGYEDLDGVMAALTNLDLLISVDNSLVHFAGAWESKPGPWYRLQLIGDGCVTESTRPGTHRWNSFVARR